MQLGLLGIVGLKADSLLVSQEHSPCRNVCTREGA